MLIFINPNSHMVSNRWKIDKWFTLLIVLVIAFPVVSKESDSTSIMRIDGTFTTPAIKSIAEEDTAHLCDGISNTYECTLAKEPILLRYSGNLARRENSELIISIADGSVKVYPDSLEREVGSVAYTYAGFLPAINFHVIELHFYEGSSYYLLSCLSGEETHSDGPPIISPDSTRVAAASSDLDAQYDATSLRIWRINKGRLILEFQWTADEAGLRSDSAWGPVNLHWVAPNELSADCERLVNIKHSDKIRIRLTEDGWKLTHIQ